MEKGGSSHHYGNSRKEHQTNSRHATTDRRPSTDSTTYLSRQNHQKYITNNTNTYARNHSDTVEVVPTINPTTTSESRRAKIPIRRCTSVDVAELHRKKRHSRGQKRNKIDRENLLQPPKSSQPPRRSKSTNLESDDRSKQHGEHFTRRPNSLKLSEKQSLLNNEKPSRLQHNSIPTPPSPPPHHSSRRHTDTSSPVEEPYSPNTDFSRQPTSQIGDRLKKVAIDFQLTDDLHSDAFPSGEGYRKHGRKWTFPSAPYVRLRYPVSQNVGLQIIGSFFFAFLAFLVFCPVAAILIGIFPVCFLFKRVFICCCCCCYRNKDTSCACCVCGERLTLVERFWLQEDRKNPNVVQSIITVEHGLSANQIRNLILSRLVSAVSDKGQRLYPRFSQKIVQTCWGYTWTRDEEFLIHNHVFTMPNGIESQEDLQEYVSDQASRSLSFTQSLWELQILTSFSNEADTVLLFRSHPCLLDGISMVKVLYKSIADVDSVTAIPPRFAQETCLDTFKSILYGPLLFLNKFVCSKSEFNMLHGKHIHLSGKKVISWSVPFNLRSAVRIKQVTRSTLTEVLLSVAAGTIRNYLQVYGIPNPYDIRGSIPVYFGMGRKSGKLGNHIVFLNVTLPTNTEGIVPRLWQMKENMSKVRSSSFFSLTLRAFTVSSHFLPEFIWKKLWTGVISKCTCVVSSLPGPEICLRLASRKIKTIVNCFPPVHQVALAVSFFSYDDQIQMAVSADRSVLPNPELLTKDFIFQMETLMNQLANRRIPGEHLSRKAELALLSNEIRPEETAEQIQKKMSMVHQELQNLKHQLDANRSCQLTEHDHKLMKKIESMKEQFRELLVEMRKRKAAEQEAAITFSEEDSTDDDDFDIPRRPFRRRAMSVSSRLSSTSISSTMRPLAAITPITPDYGPESPLITEKQVPYTSYTRHEDNEAMRPYNPSHLRPKKLREDFEILEYQYSPSMERRYKMKH